MPRPGVRPFGWVLSCAAIVGLLVRLRILSAGTAGVLLRYGSDDLFYFTVVAANIAAGKGVSFDGEHPTSGIQPLFAFLLVPFAPLFQNEPGLALRIDLGLVTLLTLAAGLLIPGTVERLMAARALRGDPAAARRPGLHGGRSCRSL